MRSPRFLTAAVVALATALTVAGALHAAGPDGPRVQRPPHHADDGFRNPGFGGSHDPPLAVALPFFARRIATTALALRGRGAPRRIANDGAFLRENALGSVPTVTWVGHSTLLVQMGHATFLTDPTWSRTASPVPLGPRRYVDPGLRIDHLPRIDFVVVSHNHYDHMDLDTLRELARRGTRFFVPLGNAATLEENDIRPVEELDWWDSRQVGSVGVHCVPARHWSRRGVFDMNRALWSGWVVTTEDRRFYFAGDTGSFDGFTTIGRRLGPIDLAAIPIGAYEPRAMMAPSHLDPDEAIGAVVALGARHSVAIHFGTFDLSDEPLDEPPRRFREASERAGRGAHLDWLMDVGETREW